jgi:hypothetical protein
MAEDPWGDYPTRLLNSYVVQEVISGGPSLRKYIEQVHGDCVSGVVAVSRACHAGMSFFLGKE